MIDAEDVIALRTGLAVMAVRLGTSACWIGYCYLYFGHCLLWLVNTDQVVIRRVHLLKRNTGGTNCTMDMVKSERAIAHLPNPQRR